MNLREGTRRLALLLGVVGAIVPFLVGCDATGPQSQNQPSTAVPSEKVQSTPADRQRFKTVEVYPVGMRQNLALDSLYRSTLPDVELADEWREVVLQRPANMRIIERTTG